MRLILACGSRDYANEVAVYSTLAQCLAEYPRGGFPTVLHGAARGADRLAGRIAQALGFPVEAMPADWDAHGKAAGYIRNLAMLDRGPDLVLAFWDGTSRGTAHTVSVARERGIPVRVVGP